jgi:glycosyl transferase family 87
MFEDSRKNHDCMKPPIRVVDAVWIAIFALALALVTWRTFSRLRPIDNPRDTVDRGLGDFQDVVYYPARAATTGINPYDPRPADQGGVYLSQFPAGNYFPVYAPLIFVASLPFAALALSPAEVAYCAWNVVLLLAYAYALLRVNQFTASIAAVCGLATALLISRAGHANFYFGNVALPMALATLGAWHFADRRPWLSAFCTTISLIKATFGGPLVLLLLLRGTYRPAILGLVSATIVNLAIMAVLLPRELTNPQAIALLADNQSTTDNDPAVDSLNSASRVDVVMVAERFLGLHLPTIARWTLTFAVIGIAGWRTRVLQHATAIETRDRHLLSTAIASLTVVICIYHNVYDALFAAPATLAAWRLASTTPDARTRRMSWAIFAGSLVPAVNYLCSQQVVEYLAASFPPLASLLTTSALWSLLCIASGAGLLTAWVLLLARSRPAARPVVFIHSFR